LLLAGTIATLASGKPLKQSECVSENIFKNYMGTYQMIAYPKRTFVITGENEQKYIAFSQYATVPLIELTSDQIHAARCQPDSYN
jgi:hypothetical protein